METMSKLLINEQPLQFLPTLAKALGNSDKALILQQINYWLNNPNSGKEVNGHKWIRNTVNEWHQQFPWIAEKTVQRYLKDLEGKGILVARNLNKLKFDRTKWYTIDFDELDKLVNTKGQFDQMEGDGEPQRKGTTRPNQKGTDSPTQKGTISPHQYHRLPETSSENSTENNKALAQPGTLSAQRREVIKYLNEKTGKHFKPDADGNKKAINPRLKEGYTVADMKHIIDVKYAEWHGVVFANGQPGDNYLRPETLFRVSKIEGYINQQVPVKGTHNRPKYGHQHIEEPLPDWAKKQDKPKKQLSDAERKRLIYDQEE